jgi:hypothetical protein
LLQRNDPGWFVGEHMQDCRLLAADGEEKLTDLPGERAPAVEVASFTRLGEAER